MRNPYENNEYLYSDEETVKEMLFFEEFSLKSPKKVADNSKPTAFDEALMEACEEREQI